MNKSEIEEAVNGLTNFVNNYSHDPEQFITAFCRQHRTLQQSTFRLFLQLIEFMATEDYPTDGRNQGSHELAKRLLEGFKLAVIEDQMNNGVSKKDAEQFVESEYAKPHRYLGYV